MNAAERKARRDERKATPNALHSAEKVRYGSPTKVVAIARAVLGDISVDPFSEPAFNAHVEASRILTGERGLDGYKDRWISDGDCPRADHILHDYPYTVRHLVPGAVSYTSLVNPPGSQDGENIKQAWRVLDMLHWLQWFDGGAVWVAFNLNQMQTTQCVSIRSILSPEFIRCLPASRQRFLDENGVEEDQPTHPMMFCLLPAADPARAEWQRAEFRRLASPLGEVF